LRMLTRRLLEPAMRSPRPMPDITPPALTSRAPSRSTAPANCRGLAAWHKNLHFLADVRAKLRRNQARSAVFDAERFCRNLEAAYEGMWQRQGRGEPPAGFAIESRR
jgi:hypothetical protein